MEQIDAWSKNRRQIEKSAMKGAINIFLVYGEGDSLLNNFFFRGRGRTSWSSPLVHISIK